MHQKSIFRATGRDQHRYPASQFDGDGQRIRASSNLDSLTHLISLNAQMTVCPLWGETGEAGQTTPTVGVTRQDFRFPVPVRPHFTLAGALFSMGRNRWWEDNLYFRLHVGLRDLCVQLTSPNYPWLIDDGCGGAFRFVFRLNFSVLGRPTIGNARDRIPDSDDDIIFGLGFRIPNIIPFIRFKFRDDYCRLNGGFVTVVKKFNIPVFS